jgi:hypothetical protein
MKYRVFRGHANIKIEPPDEGHGVLRIRTQTRLSGVERPARHGRCSYQENASNYRMTSNAGRAALSVFSGGGQRGRCGRKKLPSNRHHETWLRSASRELARGPKKG